MTLYKTIIMSVLMFSLPATALEPMSAEEMSATSGQGGVYLTGDLTINENGGPLNLDGPAQNNHNWQVNCSANNADRRCGARLALNTGGGRGWLILDNIRGRFSFEGLTLRTRKITDGFNGDGNQFNEDVFEVGLPNQLDYEDASLTLAGASGPRPTDSNYQQVDIVTLTINGVANLQGNALIFPTGD